MRIIITALLLAIPSQAMANPLDLRRPGATGGTFVLNDDLRRRAYAEREAKESLPMAERVVVRGLAIHIENCLVELTGAEFGGMDPVVIENRRRPLSDLTFDCVGFFGQKKFGKQ